MDRKCYDCGHLQSQHDDDMDACEWDCKVEGCKCDCINLGCFICDKNHSTEEHKVYVSGLTDGMFAGVDIVLAIAKKERRRINKNRRLCLTNGYELTIKGACELAIKRIKQKVKK